jgi:hypothetical protein
MAIYLLFFFLIPLFGNHRLDHNCSEREYTPELPRSSQPLRGVRRFGSAKQGYLYEGYARSFRTRSVA